MIDLVFVTKKSWRLLGYVASVFVLFVRKLSSSMLQSCCDLIKILRRVKISSPAVAVDSHWTLNFRMKGYVY
jgi:hypothetical protein